MTGRDLLLEFFCRGEEIYEVSGNVGSIDLYGIDKAREGHTAQVYGAGFASLSLKGEDPG